MQITIVGTGTAVPDAERVCSGYFVQVAGLRLLLDCGSGVVHHMAQFGLDWSGITHLLITHFHNDHIGDVPMLFFAWKWGQLPSRKQPLHLLAPKGMKQRLQQMAAAFGDHVTEPGFPMVLDEVGSEEQRLLGDVVHVRTFKTPHTAESIAFRLDAPEASLGYTGDTGYSEELAAFMTGVNVLIIECSLPDKLAMETHLTPMRVAHMAMMAAPARLVVTHVYPQLERAAIPQLLREHGWAGETVIAQDGLRL